MYQAGEGQSISGIEIWKDTAVSDSPKYVIIYTDGRADNVKDGWTWHLILDMVYNHTQSAGSATPLADILIKDKKIIVPEKLWDIGYKYGRRYYEARSQAVDAVKTEFPEPTP
jgi:hypothetical protein